MSNEEEDTCHLDDDGATSRRCGTTTEVWVLGFRV